MMHFTVATQVNVASNNIQANNAPDARTVLAELFDLLEDYGPAWYTQEHHNRAVQALLEKQN